MTAEILERPLVKTTLLFLVIALSALALGILLRPVLVPLILSFVLYALFAPLIGKLQGLGYTRSAAIAMILLALVSMVGLCVVLVFPLIIKQFGEFQSRLPALWAEMAGRSTELGAWFSQGLGLQVDMGQMTEQWLVRLQQSAASMIVSSAGFILGLAVTLFLVPLITFFLLRDFRALRNMMLGWLPNGSFELGWIIYYRVTKQLQRYIRGVFVQSIIVMIITSCGFMLMGLELAVLFGVMAGLLNLIPYIGPIIAMVLPLIMVFGSESYQAMTIVGVVGVILLAQIIDNAVVIPAVIASTVDLHPLAILLGVIIFGYVFGFLGMLVAIPMLSSAKIIFMGLLRGLHGREYRQFQYGG